MVVRPNKTGNRWNKVDPHFDGPVALGNGTQKKVTMDFSPCIEKTILWENIKAMFGLRFDSGAKNLADFINTQVCTGNYQEQGEYQNQFCN